MMYHLVGARALRVMIHISKPYKEEREGRVYLVAPFTDESQNWSEPLWFSVTPEYGEYLCDEYADSFLLLALLPAIQTGQDIKIDAPVSRKLLFNINNTVKPIFNAVLKAPREIRIEAAAVSEPPNGACGVGCGCSLGIDSLSSFLRHYGPEAPEGYHVTHLTLFNSGQLGSLDMEEVEKSFYRAVEALRPFSEEVQLPICAVNSNLNAYFAGSGVTLLQSFVLRTCACAMALQKLFAQYVYASSYAVDQFEFSSFDTSHMESAYAPLCSTENFNFILSNPMMNRVAKTDFVRRWEKSPQFLQVCCAEQIAHVVSGNAQYLEGKTKTNCGWCIKCLRTLLTLEILQGDIEMYGDTWDLAKYREHRDEYIAKVYLDKKWNVFYMEIADLIRESGYRVPARAKRLYRLGLVKSLGRKVKKAVCHPLGAVGKIARKVSGRSS